MVGGPVTLITLHPPPSAINAMLSGLIYVYCDDIPLISSLFKVHANQCLVVSTIHKQQFQFFKMN